MWTSHQRWALRRLQKHAEARLVLLNELNYLSFLNLKVGPAQETQVAPNVFTMAQYAFEQGLQIRGICRGNEPAGLALLRVMDATDQSGPAAHIPLNGEPFLLRFMVDARFQGQGLGRAALEEIVKWCQGFPAATRLFVTHELGPGNPGDFYQACGFQPLAERLNGEAVLYRPLH